MHRKLHSDSMDVAYTIQCLAHVMLNQGSLVEAETLFRNSLEMLDRLLGEFGDHSQVAIVLENLGHVLQKPGKLSEAEIMFREV